MKTLIAKLDLKPTLLFLGIILVPNFLLLLIARFDGMNLINFYPDDAFYYLQTAYNYSKSGFLSFDTVNSTTGFHPLQMLLSIAAFSLFSKSTALIAFFLLNPICYAFALVILVRGLGLRSISLTWASLTAFFVFTIHIFAAAGMETGLLILVTSIFLATFVSVTAKKTLNFKNSVALGATAALVCLTRLDMVIPIGILGLYVLLVFFQRTHVKWILLSSFVFVMVMAPYFAWMYFVQENLMPVSSLAKYGRAQSTFSTTLRALTGGQLVGSLIFYLSLFPLFAGTFELLRKHSAPRHRASLAIALSGIIYLGYVLFVAQEAFRWYLAYPTFVSVYLLLGLVFDYGSGLTRLFKGTALVFPVIILITNFFVSYTYLKHDTVSSNLLKTVNDTNKLVPYGSNIGTHDAGIIGFFSTSQVHNLDGLINSKSNLDKFLKDQRIVEYAKFYNLDYLILRAALWTNIEDQANSHGTRLQVIKTYEIPRMDRLHLIKIVK